MSFICIHRLIHIIHIVIHILSDILRYKKESRLRDSPPAAGRICDMFLIRRSAILAEHFLCNGNEVSYYIKNRHAKNILSNALR